MDTGEIKFSSNEWDIYTTRSGKIRGKITLSNGKKSILNTIAKFTQSANSAKDDLMSNFLTEKTLTHIAESTWNKIKKYEEYGTISSGIIMTLIIIQLTEMMVDLIIRGYTLQKLYGCSRHLFESIFTSVAHLLIVLNRINEMKGTNLKNREERVGELQEIVITKPTISMPLRREHNSGKLEEHELQELKPRKVVNLRPLPPLSSSASFVNSPTRPTSISQKETDLTIFSI